LILSCGCSYATGPDNAGPVVVTPEAGLPFELKVGWRALFPKQRIEVELVEVVGDSRCPSGELIRCIWQGDGAVAVAISQDDAMTRVDTLHTALDSHAIPVGELQLEFAGLAPYPEVNTPIPVALYVATFVLKTRSLTARHRRSQPLPEACRGSAPGAR
jgi:hypothetical protein